MRLQPLGDRFAVARQTPLHHTAPPTVYRQGTTSDVPQTAQINAASAAGEQICSRDTRLFSALNCPVPLLDLRLQIARLLLDNVSASSFASSSALGVVNVPQPEEDFRQLRCSGRR